MPRRELLFRENDFLWLWPINITFAATEQEDIWMQQEEEQYLYALKTVVLL